MDYSHHTVSQENWFMNPFVCKYKFESLQMWQMNLRNAATQKSQSLSAFAGMMANKVTQSWTDNQQKSPSVFHSLNQTQPRRVWSLRLWQNVFHWVFLCLLFVFVLFYVSVSFLLSVIGDMTTGRRERSSDRMAPAASLLQKADRMKRWLVSLKSLKMVRRGVQVNIRLQLSILSGLVWNVSSCKERGHLH